MDKIARYFGLTLMVLFVISSCGPAPTPEIIIQTVEVEKEVEVIKTVEVEKIVEVIKTVEVEVSSVPTAITIIFWVIESQVDGGLQFVNGLSDSFTAANPDITFEVIQKGVEDLEQDFLTASQNGSSPDIIWTVNEHIYSLYSDSLLIPVEDLFDMSLFVPSVEIDGHIWGVPITSGNHLMLIYNKNLVPEPPTTTDELITIGQAQTVGDSFGLVFDQTEPIWLIPWLGGFDGALFADDGKTPTLNTPEMAAALQFLYDIKYINTIVPTESDYNRSDTLFKGGKAAMIINGDWSLDDYQEIFGENLGVTPIPRVSDTGVWPTPFTSGTYFLIPSGLEPTKLEIVTNFVNFTMTDGNQLRMIGELGRLPGRLSSLNSPLVKEDPILAGSAEQLFKGIPMIPVREMLCIRDSIKPELEAVLADEKTPEVAATAMQVAVERCTVK
ncbi:MAG: extracellular solute-binding protein [Anaerolineaceae bacterium]|nr:extracellular solute-binding protein [Anaerolineaceae bacterium]